MNLKNNCFFWIFISLFSLSFLGCSSKPKATFNHQEKFSSFVDTVSFVERALQDTVPEFMIDRLSWDNYQYALQAIDNEEWLLARHYLDNSLKALVEEKLDTTYTKYKEVDFNYRREMSVRVLYALDEIYPNIQKLKKDVKLYQENEISLEGHENFDDSGIDSTDLVLVENFLDTLDLSQFSLPLELNERVMKEILYLSKAVPLFTESSLSRKTLYDSLIVAKLKEQKMPVDLVYLPLVESGYKLKAYSRAKASGLWQFIPETGKRYGLHVDSWVDMRRNPELATQAALAYLTRLHDEFDDWLLAMAAYNCGEGRVRRLLKEKRSLPDYDSTKSITFWDLKLPKETMHYVPRILAAMVIGHYPENYNFTIVEQKPDSFDTISVFDCLPLDLIAKTVSVSEDSIRSLNPELIKSFTPPDLPQYLLRLPKGSREVFSVAYQEMDKSQFSRWFYHTVKSGENLGLISRKYGLSVKNIQKANNMKNTRLGVGQKLLIPLPSVSVKTKTASKPKTKTKIKTHIVQLGDNLASIARHYGVSIEQLKTWNSLNSYESLKLADTLYLAPPQVKIVEKLKESSTEKVKLPLNHVVLEGETYYSIALKYGVSLETLMTANDALHKRLQVADTITIPKEKEKLKQSPSDAKSKVWTPPKTDVYTVKKGDNLYAISRKMGVSVSDLQAWNKKGESTSIVPGEKLKLKASSNIHSKAISTSPLKDKSSKEQISYHTVLQGESLWDIARRYQISIAEIQQWNGLENTKIKTGDRLRVQKPEL